MELFKRCGRCKLYGKQADLCEVEVSSHGKPKQTFAHIDCVPLWRNNAHVKVIGTKQVDAVAIRVYGVENVVHSRHRHSV